MIKDIVGTEVKVGTYVTYRGVIHEVINLALHIPDDTAIKLKGLIPGASLSDILGGWVRQDYCLVVPAPFKPSIKKGDILQLIGSCCGLRIGTIVQAKRDSYIGWNNEHVDIRNGYTGRYLRHFKNLGPIVD